MLSSTFRRLRLVEILDGGGDTAPKEGEESDADLMDEEDGTDQSPYDDGNSDNQGPYEVLQRLDPSRRRYYRDMNCLRKVGERKKTTSGESAVAVIDLSNSGLRNLEPLFMFSHTTTSGHEQVTLDLSHNPELRSIDNVIFCRNVHTIKCVGCNEGLLSFLPTKLGASVRVLEVGGGPGSGAAVATATEPLRTWEGEWKVEENSSVNTDHGDGGDSVVRFVRVD